MDNDYQSNTEKNNLCLTDVLAIERTVLANDRTLLAYVRTALSIVVAGLSFIRFFGSEPLRIVGFVLVPSGTALFVYGIRKYYQYKGKIEDKRI